MHRGNARKQRDGKSVANAQNIEIQCLRSFAKQMDVYIPGILFASNVYPFLVE